MLSVHRKKEVYRWGIWAGFIGFAVFYLLDFFYYPQYSVTLFWIRTAVLLVYLLNLIVVKYLPLKYLNHLLIVTFILSCWAISVMCYIVGDGFSCPYWVGILLINLAVSGIFVINVLEFLLPNIAILSFHFILLSFCPKVKFTDIVLNILFLVTSCGVGVTLNYIVNKVRKEEMDLYKKNQYFVKVFAHDIKNRLTSGLLNLEILKRNCLDKESINLSMDDHEHMNRVVNNLINVFSENDIVLNKQKIPIFDIVHKIKEHWAMKFRNKNIKFKIEVLGCEHIFCDYKYMELLWDNLIANAYQNTTPGGDFCIQVYQELSMTCLRFINSGEKIPREFVQEMFNKYFSYEHHTPYSKGLGLNYSKMMSHLHGGSIEYEISEKDLNTFLLRIPA